MPIINGNRKIDRFDMDNGLYVTVTRIYFRRCFGFRSVNVDGSRCLPSIFQKIKNLLWSQKSKRENIHQYARALHYGSTLTSGKRAVMRTGRDVTCRKTVQREQEN